jgi:hypothetical protein
MQQAVTLQRHFEFSRLGAQPAAPEIPRLLLMRWDGVEFWERNLCERDRTSLKDVKRAIGTLKIVVDGYRGSAPTASGFDACKIAFAHVAKVSWRVGNDLRMSAYDKNQTQLWRGKHIAHLLEGIEDESTAASDAAAEFGSGY